MRGKFLFLMLVFSAFAGSLNCQTRGDERVRECRYLSFAQAEKILGAPVELVTNSWTFTKDVTRTECAYRAVEKEAASGKEINLYFLLEESSTENHAGETYRKIRESNKDHQGVEPLTGIGDEAYFHSDEINFHFLMARKGKFSIRLKIAKASRTTSPEELKAFAKRVIEKL